VHVNGQILARTTVPQVTLRGLANAARETVYAVACNQYGCSLPSPQAAFFTPPLPAQASAVAQAAVAAVRPAAAPAATTASRIAAALTQAADHARLATEAANAGNVTGAQQDVALAQQSLATATALGATAAQTAAARAAITAAQNAVAAAQRRAAAQAAAQAPSSTLGARRLYELGAGPPPTTTPTTTTAPAARTTTVQPNATVANLSSLLARPPAPPTPAPPPAPGYAPQLTEAQQALARAIASLQQSQDALRYVLGVGPTRWPGGRAAWQGEVNSITTAIRYWQAQIRQLQAA
jgi:hypothetical protein